MALKPLGVTFGDNVPKWFQDDLVKQPHSKTHKSVEVSVYNTTEALTFPVHTSTSVYDVKCMVAARVMVDPANLAFVVKQGCAWRTQFDTEEIARKVFVKGIKSFARQRHTWPALIAIIGTGHAGLRQAMYFLKMKELNFVVYDRKSQVGGTSWIDQANVTSKLQTELGTYHLQYDEDSPVPRGMATWPTRDELLAHFAEVAEEYGVMPYTKMCTNVKEITIEAGSKREQDAEMAAKGRTFGTQAYGLLLEPTDGTGDGRGDHIGATGEPCYEVTHSAIIMYPGNLTIPRRFEYKGEDEFGCPIAYAICNDFDYEQVMGKEVAIVGHGAFAVENLRTCLEYSAKKVFIICRRKNLCCPRVCSWFVNQSATSISARLYMLSSEPMFALTGFDPWAFHSVHANEKRTNVSIVQKARFGIGDVYFIAIAMGMCEVAEDDVKRLSAGTVHLVSGRKLQVDALLKLLGFNGNFDVDRLMHIKTMHGYWPEADFRRFLIAEPIGVNATNFGGTSFSPGLRSWVELPAHFLWFPNDFSFVSSSGMLPTHSADPENDRPAYVVDARHGTATSIMLPSFIVAFQESQATYGPIKRQKQLECHPMRKYLEECEAEWQEYGQKWKERGAPHPIPAYPYTPQLVQRFLAMEQEEVDAAAKRTAG